MSSKTSDVVFSSFGKKKLVAKKGLKMASLQGCRLHTFIVCQQLVVDISGRWQRGLSHSSGREKQMSHSFLDFENICILFVSSVARMSVFIVFIPNEAQNPPCEAGGFWGVGDIFVFGNTTVYLPLRSSFSSLYLNRNIYCVRFFFLLIKKANIAV